MGNIGGKVGSGILENGSDNLFGDGINKSLNFAFWGINEEDK